MSRILDGFKVPRNGLGRRRWKLYVLDELLARRGDEVTVTPQELDVERQALEREGRPVEDAERRVRLGALLGRIITDYGIQLKQHEINYIMAEEARRRHPVEEDTVQFFRSNWQAQATLQASVMEAKALDLLYTMARAS